MIGRYSDHLTSCWSSLQTINREGQACAQDIRKLLAQEELDDDDRLMICQVVQELPEPTQDTVINSDAANEAEGTQQAPDDAEDNIEPEIEVTDDPLVDPFNLTLESDDEIPPSNEFLTHDPILS